MDFQTGNIYLDGKTGKREVPINGTTRETLHKLQPNRFQSEYVFSRHGKPIKNFREAFNSATKRAGIEDFRFHDLRHCFASFLVQAGESILTVSELLGHRSLKMTQRYSHLAPSQKRRAVELLDTKMDTQVDTSEVTAKND